MFFVSMAKVWLKLFFLAKHGRFEKKEFRTNPMQVYTCEFDCFKHGWLYIFQHKIMGLTWPFCRTRQDFHIFGRLSKAVHHVIPSPCRNCMVWCKGRTRPLAAHGSLAWAQFSFICGQVILWHKNTHVVCIYVYIYVCLHTCLCVYVCIIWFSSIYTSDIGIVHRCGQVIIVQFKYKNVMLVFVTSDI